MALSFTSATRLRLLAALAALGFVVLGLPLWGGLMLRDRIIAEAKREIATQADIAVVAIKRRLQGLRYALYGLPIWLDGPALESGLFDTDVHLALRRLHDVATHGIGFIAIAPSGRFVASAVSVETPGMPRNVLHRPNIATLGDMTPSGLAISAPYLTVATHVAGRPAAAISRRLPNGGWVQAVAQLDLGLGIMLGADLGAGSSTWLLREDGQVVANWPPPVLIPGPRYDPAVVIARPMAGAQLTSASPDDPFADRRAIIAVRSLPEFGLVLVVRRDLSVVLGSWMAGMATISAALLLALLATALLARRATRMAEALTRSEDHAQMVANSLGLLLWSRPTRQGRARYHNRAAEPMTGYTTEELTERAGVWREKVIHPDDRERIAREVATADLSQELHQTYRIVRRDGAVRWVDQRVREAPGGGIVGVTHDVTEIRAAQERLARSEAELAEAMRISGLGRWRFDPVADRFEMSEPILRQYGVDPACFDPTRENLDALVLPEDRPALAEALARAAEKGEPVEVEYRIRRPDGAIRHRWARAVRETDADGPTGAIVGVCRDITESREAAAQLAHASRMTALGQLTGGIAHDVNNMLTVVSLNLDLLADEVRPGSTAHEALDAARRAATGGSELTAQLLAFARRQPLSPTSVPVGPLFADLAPLLSRTLGRSVTPIVTAAPDTPPVRADAAQLRSALVNLAINARDAMPEGGTIRITAEPAEEPGFVAFSVADEGTGMPPEVAARAFEPFFTTKPAGKGTGLGLSQVYGFVTQSQGTIGIESEPGRGTTVRFTLPVAQAAAAETAARAAALRHGAHVLVVEDEPALRAAVVAMCRAEGLVVSEAENAAAALGLLEAGLAPDLLFTDINLGAGPDGTALAALLRRRRPGLAVLFATGFTAAAELPEGEALLRKPYTREALMAAIAAALEAAKQPEPAAV